MLQEIDLIEIGTLYFFKPKNTASAINKLQQNIYT